MVLYCLAVTSVLLSPVSTHPSDVHEPAQNNCEGITLSCGPLADVARHIRASTIGKTSVFECASSVECPVIYPASAPARRSPRLAVVSVMSPYRRSKRITGAASPIRLVMLAAVAMAATALFARASCVDHQ